MTRPLAAITALLVATALSTAAPSAAESTGPEVVVSSNTTVATGDGLRTPDIISTSPTHVVTVWREGFTNGQYDNGTIKYAYSDDAGSTWSTPAVLGLKDATYGWHYVILYRVGTTLYAFLGRTSATSTNGQPVTTFLKKSTDGGVTWVNQTIDTSAVPSSFVIAGRPIKVGAYHIAPIWLAGKVAIMRSTDMVTWTAGSWAPDPDAVQPGESQVVVDQNDPTKLFMVARIFKTSDDYFNGAVYAYTASSSDSGLTWTALTEDRNIPNFQTKTYFTKSSSGAYLTINNTFGGTFSGPIGDRPPHYRDILFYKVRKPGQAWGAGRFFADGPKVVTGRANSTGWDTYPMADEYAPGKFFVVWEHDTSAIKVRTLDISDAFTTLVEDFSNLDDWTIQTNGGSASTTSGRLTLNNAASTVTTVSQATAPQSGFVVNYTGKITNAGTLNTTTGVGATMAVTVTTGTRQLSMTAQNNGVYAKTSASPSTWQLVHPRTDDGLDHQYRAIVSAAGVARLFIDSLDTGVEWAIPTSAAAKQTAIFASGSPADPVTSQVDYFSVEDNVVSTTFDDLAGWDNFTNGGTVTSSSGQVVMSSPSTGINGTTWDLQPSCDFTVDFRGQVTDYAPINTSNGQGTNLVVKATNGAKRIMVSVQSDGVYTIKKGQTDWSRIYTLSNAGSLASWRVDTNSGGEAKLYRNGGHTGATWSVQDKSAEDAGNAPQVSVFSSGRSGDAASSRLDWLRTTCNYR